MVNIERPRALEGTITFFKHLVYRFIDGNFLGNADIRLIVKSFDWIAQSSTCACVCQDFGLKVDRCVEKKHTVSVILFG